jgi:hypothetical protein
MTNFEVGDLIQSRLTKNIYLVTSEPLRYDNVFKINMFSFADNCKGWEWISHLSNHYDKL